MDYLFIFNVAEGLLGTGLNDGISVPAKHAGRSHTNFLPPEATYDTFAFPVSPLHSAQHSLFCMSELYKAGPSLVQSSPSIRDKHAKTQTYSLGSIATSDIRVNSWNDVSPSGAQCAPLGEHCTSTKRINHWHVEKNQIGLNKWASIATLHIGNCDGEAFGTSMHIGALVGDGLTPSFDCTAMLDWRLPPHFVQHVQGASFSTLIQVYVCIDNHFLKHFTRLSDAK